MTNQNAPDTTDIAMAAATIFRDRILNDVGEENEKLVKENSRLQPLRDYLNRIEIRCGGNGMEDDGVGDVIAATGFDKAKFRLFDDDNFEVHVRIECDPRPIAHYRANDSEIRICTANYNIGQSPWIILSTVVKEGQDDEILVSIDISHNIHVIGEIKGVTFTPTEIQINGTPELRETIEMLFFPLPTKFSDSTSLCIDDVDAMTPNDELHQVTLGALGTNLHMQLLEENRKLKRENEKLHKIKARIGMVRISSSSGQVVISLEDGELVEDHDETLIWKIKLAEEDFPTLALERVDNTSIDSFFEIISNDFEVCVSGMVQGIGDVTVALLDSPHGIIPRVKISCSSDVTLWGVVFPRDGEEYPADANDTLNLFQTGVLWISSANFNFGNQIHHILDMVGIAH